MPYCWLKYFLILTSSCLKLAVVHDLAECIVGDITPSDPMGKEEKHRRERVKIFYYYLF